MPVLYDRENNPVEVPEEQVAQALASGKYAFPKGADVIMRGETGELYDVPPEEAGEMYQRGYRVESVEEARVRERGEKYGGAGGQLATAAHAIGNTLTFGALDYLGAQAGGKAYTKPVKEMKAENPNLHLTAELATIAGSFLVNPASAVGKLTGLPRGVAKIGRGVEKAVLKGLGGAKGGLVRQAIAKGTAMGTGAGVEGAVWNAGNFLGEASLGETEATAENLLGYVGMGAMWGGVAGGGMGAGGEILRRGLGAGANFAKRSSKSVVNMWERATGNKAVPGLADAIEGQIANPKVGRYAKTMGAAIREEPENIARFIQKGPAGKEARRIGAKSAKERDAFVRSMSDDMDVLEDVYEGASEQMMGGLKTKNMKSLRAVGNDVAAASEATGMLERVKNETKRLMDMKDEAGHIYKEGTRLYLNRINRTALEHERRLQKVLLKGGDDVLAKQHTVVDSFKREIGIQKRGLEKAQPTILVKEVRDLTKGFYADVQEHLVNPAHYGAVGIAQGKFNPVWSRVIGRGKGKAGRALREKIGEAEWRAQYATNRGSMEHMINDMGRARNKSMEDFYISQLDDKIEFVRLAKETFEDLPPGLVKKLDKGEALAKKMRAEYDKTYKTVALQNQMGDIIQKSSQLQGVLPMGAGAGVGYLLGGEEGLALGLGLSVFTNPGRLIQIRAALDRMSVGTDLKIVKSLKRYIGKATGKIKKAARGLLAPASLKILQGSDWGEKRTKDKNRHQAFERRSKELTEFLSNPQKTMDRISKNVGDVSEVAPNVATAMQVKAVQSARYLYDRMPKPLGQDTLLTGDFKPSDLDLAKFERIAAVIDNPENALKSLRAGMLTVEEVDALRENYPKMYERIVVTLAEQIPELRKELPYKERVQLSILFDVPVDATMETEFMQTMAVVGMVSPMPPGETPGQKQPRSKAATGDYDKLSIDTASMTDTQGTEYRKLT